MTKVGPGIIEKVGVRGPIKTCMKCVDLCLVVWGEQREMKKRGRKMDKACAALSVRASLPTVYTP